MLQSENVFSQKERMPWGSNVISQTQNKSDPKNRQILHLNADSSLESYYSNGQYCAKATSVVIVNKHRK